MKAKKREKNEKRIKDALRELFGRNLVSMEFFYYRGGRKISVVYEDFKPYTETKALVRNILQGKWSLTLYRNHSNERIKNTLFDVYSHNRVAVVDMANGELKPYTIQGFIHGLMAES